MALRHVYAAAFLLAAGTPPPSANTEQIAPGPYGSGKSLYEYFYGDPRRPTIDPQIRCWYRCPPAQIRRPA